MAEAYKVQGLKLLQRNLRKYDKDMAKQLRVANKRAAQVIADEAKSKAPVSSGALQRSVGVTAGQTSAYVKAGSASRVPYANPVHWGWQNRPQGGYNPATPFISRALKSKHDDMVSEYEKAMEDLKKGSNL